MPMNPSRIHNLRSRLLLGVAVIAITLGLAASQPRAAARAQAPAAQAPVVQAPAAAQARQLANGLTVAVEERPDARTLGVALVVRAGTRDDPADRIGAVSLLALSMLSGSESRPSMERLTADVSASGGSVDLSVDPDLTEYQVHVPAGELYAVLGMLSDMVVNPNFGVAAVSDALLPAMVGKYASVPPALANALWPDHPAGRSLATLDEEQATQDVEALSFRDLTALRDRYFVARNMFLSVVGPVSASQVLAEAQQDFGRLPSGEYQAIQPVEAGPPEAGRTSGSTSGNQATVIMGYPTVGRCSPDSPVAGLLAYLLGSTTGALTQDLRIAHGLVYTVDLHTIALQDVGALYVTAHTGIQNADAVVDRLSAIFDQLRQNPPSDPELDRIGEQRRLTGLAALESTSSAADLYAVYAAYGEPLDPVAHLAMSDGVTSDDVRRFASEYLTPERAVIHVESPEELPADLQPPSSGAAPQGSGARDLLDGERLPRYAWHVIGVDVGEP